MAMHKEDDEHKVTKHTPQSWEVLSLLGPYMEPETLAIASCVSTTCSQCFSSENLWKSKLTAHHEPFNFAAPAEMSSYKRIVSTVESAAKHRGNNHPAEPKISLSDLIFTVYVSAGSKEATVVKKGEDLSFGSKERFQVEVDVSNSRFVAAGMKDVRMVWQVVYGDYHKMFRIVDTRRSSVDTNLGWFTDELPTPKHSYLDGSNLMGDVKPSFNGEVLEKVGFAIVNSNSWKSLYVNDVLRYLQCFLVD